MTNVLIAGCGDVGTALGLRLSADGCRVWGLRRRSDRLPDGLVPVAADLADRASLAALPNEIDLVYYLAAGGEASDAGYRRTYVTGIRYLLDALQAVGASPRRLFYASSTGVYGQDQGEWVDEDSATEPSRFSGRRLLEGEAAAGEGSVPVTVVRFAGIYGPGRRALIDRVCRALPCAAEPPSYTNRIHRDDCAAVLQHLARLADPARCYIAADNRPVARREVVDWLADRLALPRPPLAAQPGAGGGKRCRNDRLRASGYRFLFPTYREGYGAIIGAHKGGGAEYDP